MKSLMIAPLVIALTGCSNNLAVKTDLGEKYIVKDSAVTVKPFTSSDAITERSKNTPVEDCIERNKNDYSTTASDCQRWWGRQGSIAMSKESWGLFDEDLKILKESNLKLIAKEVTFREIFIDLNGNKNAGTYKTIFCLNDSGISNTYSDKNDRTKFLRALLYTKKLEKRPDSSSPLAIEAVKVKVCDQYSKF